MYKNKTKQRSAVKKAVQKHRNETRSEQGITKGITSHPDILDKLIDPIWRKRLEKICYSFENSHNPKYKEMVWLGDCNLSTACDWLGATE